MFEITCIENLTDGSLQICSFGVDDDVVDEEVKMLAKNEEQCALVRNYTIIAEYQRYNTLDTYYHTSTRTFMP